MRAFWGGTYFLRVPCTDVCFAPPPQSPSNIGGNYQRKLPTRSRNRVRSFPISPNFPPGQLKSLKSRQTYAPSEKSETRVLTLTFFSLFTVRHNTSPPPPPSRAHFLYNPTYLQGHGEEVPQPGPAAPLLELARPDEHGQGGVRLHLRQAFHASRPPRHVHVEHLRGLFEGVPTRETTRKRGWKR